MHIQREKSAEGEVIIAVATDPTCINVETIEITQPTKWILNGRRLERTEPNQVHFSWGSRIN